MPPRRHLGRSRSFNRSRDSNQFIDDLSCNTRFIEDHDGALYVQETELRKNSERAPMGAYMRRKLFWFQLFKKKENSEEPRSRNENENSCHQTKLHSQKQYYVSNVSRKKNTWQEWLFDNFDPHKIEYEVGGLYCDYVNWTYTANPIYLFLSFLVFFFIQLFVFSLFILIAGKLKPSCITISGESFHEFDESMTYLADAFALSWSTFTTVGYGMIYPTTGMKESNQESCTIVTFLLTTESLVGVLYSGMCAALLFGKVVRIQAHAQVEFSNALCVKYQVPVGGRKKFTGCMRDSIPENESLEELQAYQDKALKQLSQKKTVCACPTLSFQIVNQKANKSKGGIMDATIKAIGSHSLGDTKSKFTRVEMIETEHPFFKQVWIGCHVLNHTSPLLRAEARQVIAENKGSWPVKWCEVEAIRNKLSFNELTITISGVSNITASSVYKYKTYRYTDLLIGYEFAPILYKKEGADSLKVDMTLINDVVEQSFDEAECTDDNIDKQIPNRSDDFDCFITKRNDLDSTK